MAETTTKLEERYRVWSCHEWGRDGAPLGCPMARAFGVHTLSAIPPLYRWQAERFIQLFDAGLIPLPSPAPGGPA